jgi:hypothetical protein
VQLKDRFLAFAPPLNRTGVPFVIPSGIVYLAQSNAGNIEFFLQSYSVSERIIRMSQKLEKKNCFNCGIGENERPLLVLRYKGLDAVICPQCLPQLIHHPEKVAEQLQIVADHKQ